ncbi:hypothetical protein CPB84DRAFT_1791526 [Gymnopilus junonius]|uniref:F-box domain-containing protein n=1 Tax=Gymnopilus junonius TaxID=109634 RepID=A0A9P5TJ65_GYMJU|nr:hypothetical protein CPB84DRAFT_1791526 [Gymnopilus junonius]
MVDQFHQENQAYGSITNLLSLPIELIQNVACMAAEGDRRHLRLVCKHLGHILESQVLHTIYVKFHNEGPSLKRNISMIRLLATAPASTPFSRSTRCLVLGSLSPRLNYLLWVYRTKMLRDDSYNPPALSIAEDGMMASAEDKIRKYLFKAIVSLSNLQSVRWTTAKSDEAWCQTIVIDALNSLPAFRDLTIDMDYLQVDLPLSLLQNLSRISISTPSSAEVNSASLHNFAQAIALSSPGQITNVELVRQHYYSSPTTADPSASLHHYLRFCADQGSFLQLRHLRIKNLSFRLDEITSPHLIHLTSLDLSNIQEPALENSFGSTVSEIWIELARLKIHLEEISVSAIPISFLDYLKHYPGLKLLALKVPAFNSREQSEQYASLFFRDGTLDQHVETLEDLTIDASFEDYWCFGEHNISSISSCRRLKHLSMAISTEDLRVPAAAQQSGSVWDDALGVLISTVASHLPDLAHLSITPAHPERFRSSYLSGNSVSNHFVFAREKLVEHLEAYHAPTPLFKLPIVTIDDRGDPKAFEPELECRDDFSFWRYPIPSENHGLDWIRETRIGA